MPRQSSLRKKRVGKSVYWFTKAGGDTYLGNVEDVPFSEAKKLFSAHLKSVSDNEASNKSKDLTAGGLIELFLAWVQSKRSVQTFTTRKLNCSRFANFTVGSRSSRIAALPANKVRGEDLEAWLKHLEDDLDQGPQTRLHAEVSIRHCWNWATKHPSPIPYLSPTFRPFSSIERTSVPLKALTENDLISRHEYESVFAAAKLDLDQFRRFGTEKTLEKIGTENCRQSEVYSDFSEMLRCYFFTGARTNELVMCEVGDVLLQTKQIILGKHKRSRNQTNPTVRYIALNPESLSILKRNCEGKEKTDRVFLNSNGEPWTVRAIAHRLTRIKQLAAKLKYPPIRKSMSIYDFRHLWISEALMTNIDIATVAKMAGTSIAMIERVYGHFRNEHLQETQSRLDAYRQNRINQS